MLRFATLPLATIRSVVGLFALFCVVLGVSSFVLYPQGITYETNPLIHTIWLLFGIIIVGRFASTIVQHITFSRKSIFAIIGILLIGLASPINDGHLIARSVKILEILFQDLVIAATLVTIGRALSDQVIEYGLSIAFALMHVPLIFVEPLQHVIAVVLGALILSYVSIVLFLKNNRDIGMIIIPHMLFYLFFGTALSIVFW